MPGRKGRLCPRGLTFPWNETARQTQWKMSRGDRAVPGIGVERRGGQGRAVGSRECLRPCKERAAQEAAGFCEGVGMAEDMWKGWLLSLPFSSCPLISILECSHSRYLLEHMPGSLAPCSGRYLGEHPGLVCPDLD